MKSKTVVCSLIVATALMACSGGEAERSGPWVLNNTQSQLSYLTIKNRDVVETNWFRELSGTVSRTGEVRFTVHINSLDTRNSTRDPRMFEHVLKPQTYPVATASTQIDLEALSDMPVGSAQDLYVDMDVEFLGISINQGLPMRVHRLGPNRVQVINLEPLVIDAEEFGFVDGIETLRGLAQLDEISPIAPVTAALIFER